MVSDIELKLKLFIQFLQWVKFIMLIVNLTTCYCHVTSDSMTWCCYIHNEHYNSCPQYLTYVYNSYLFLRHTIDILG